MLEKWGESLAELKTELSFSYHSWIPATDGTPQKGPLSELSCVSESEYSAQPCRCVPALVETEIYTFLLGYKLFIGIRLVANSSIIALSN